MKIQNLCIYFQFNLNELFWVILTSFLLTIFFETPFSNMKKLLFQSSSRSAKQTIEIVNEPKEIIYDKSDVKFLKD